MADWVKTFGTVEGFRGSGCRAFRGYRSTEEAETMRVDVGQMTNSTWNEEIIKDVIRDAANAGIQSTK